MWGIFQHAGSGIPLLSLKDLVRYSVGSDDSETTARDLEGPPQNLPADVPSSLHVRMVEGRMHRLLSTLLRMARFEHKESLWKAYCLRLLNRQTVVRSRKPHWICCSRELEGGFVSVVGCLWLSILLELEFLSSMLRWGRPFGFCNYCDGSTGLHFLPCAAVFAVCRLTAGLYSGDCFACAVVAVSVPPVSIDWAKSVTEGKSGKPTNRWNWNL